MTIGERIKAERERQGLTQEELAQKLGYAHRSAVNKIEAKTSLPTKTIQKIADALGVAPRTLMGWEDDIHAEYQIDGERFNTMRAEIEAELLAHGNVDYYENPETAELAQKFKDNPQLKTLFDVQSDMSADDLEALYAMALALKKKENP